MRAAVEPFVAIILVMNLVVLPMSGRIAWVGRIRPRRILLGAAAGTVYALATWTFFPLGPALFAPVTLLMAWSVAPTHSFGVLVRRSFIVLGCAFLCGGTAYAAAQALQNRAGALRLLCRRQRCGFAGWCARGLNDWPPIRWGFAANLGRTA